MIPIAREVETNLRTLVDDAFSQIEGIPGAEVNAWRPALGLEDINTFYALLTHLMSSGRWWLNSVAAGEPSNRNRPSEFVATGDIAVLRAMADQWLSDTHDWLITLTNDDLGRVVAYRDLDHGDPAETSIAYCLIHAIEHTAVHLGHLHIQRQIWNAEHAATNAPSS